MNVCTKFHDNWDSSSGDHEFLSKISWQPDQHLLQWNFPPHGPQVRALVGGRPLACHSGQMCASVYENQSHSFWVIEHHRLRPRYCYFSLVRFIWVYVKFLCSEVGNQHPGACATLRRGEYIVSSFWSKEVSRPTSLQYFYEASQTCVVCSKCLQKPWLDNEINYSFLPLVLTFASMNYSLALIEFRSSSRHLACIAFLSSRWLLWNFGSHHPWAQLLQCIQQLICHFQNKSFVYQRGQRATITHPQSTHTNPCALQWGYLLQAQHLLMCVIVPERDSGSPGTPPGWPPSVYSSLLRSSEAVWLMVYHHKCRSPVTDLL